MDDELEKRLREKLGADYDSKVEEKISSFGGLLTASAAVLLLCRENGIDTEREIPLSQAAKTRLPFSFEAHVDRVFPVQEFAGGAARSVRLHVSDGKHEATVVLWNEHASFAEKRLRAGYAARFSGAYFRDGEISLGKNGRVEVLSFGDGSRIAGLSHGICSVEGEVREIEPDYHYIDKKTGEKKRLSSFLLCQGRDCRRVVVWQPDGKNQPKQGETVLVENVLFKNGELHFNSSSRMVRKGKEEELVGTFGGASFDGSTVVFLIGNEKLVVPCEDALSLLGIRSVPKGVEEETFISIKAGSLIGKQAKYRLEGNRLRYLVFEKN
ncbi:MAG: hypothetical protein QW568_00655 [Candidatus Anstonellaceae archaeon]